MGEEPSEEDKGGPGQTGNIQSKLEEALQAHSQDAQPEGKLNPLTGISVLLGVIGIDPFLNPTLTGESQNQCSYYEGCIKEATYHPGIRSLLEVIIMHEPGHFGF